MQGSRRRPSSASSPMLKRLERRPNKPVAVAIQRGLVLGGDCEGGWDDLRRQILEPERVPLDQSAKTDTPVLLPQAAASLSELVENSDIVPDRVWGRCTQRHSRCAQRGADVSVPA